MHVARFWYANESALVPAVWHYGSGIFSLLCLVFGIVSNGLVIFVFIRNGVLQRPRNYYLINLAITDIGLLLTNNSMHVISSFKKRWIFEQAGCNFYSVCGGVFGLTSISTMALISLTRLAAVNDPFSSLKLSSQFTLSCLACTWIYGSVWILPPLFGWSRFILEGFGTSCTFDYVSKDIWDRVFILVLIIGGFFIPLIVILLSYTLILMKLSQRGRQLLPQNSDDSYSIQQNPIVCFNQLSPSNGHRSRHETLSAIEYVVDDQNMTRRFRQTEARATRTALLIFTLFCSAWGPYALMALFSVFGLDRLVNAYSTAMLGLFTKVAACMNPLVYALSLNGFREQLCSYLKCACQCDGEQNHQLSPLNPDLNRKKLSHLPDSSTTRRSDPIHGTNV